MSAINSEALPVFMQSRENLHRLGGHYTFVPELIDEERVEDGLRSFSFLHRIGLNERPRLIDRIDGLVSRDNKSCAQEQEYIALNMIQLAHAAERQMAYGRGYSLSSGPRAYRGEQLGVIGYGKHRLDIEARKAITGLFRRQADRTGELSDWLYTHAAAHDVCIAILVAANASDKSRQSEGGITKFRRGFFPFLGGVIGRRDHFGLHYIEQDGEGRWVSSPHDLAGEVATYMKSGKFDPDQFRASEPASS